MLGMLSIASRDLGNCGYRIILTAAAREVIILAGTLGEGLDLADSDGYNIINLSSYHAFAISSTSGKSQKAG
jgi:hypothetical protein